MIKTKYTKLYLLAFFTTVFAGYSYASSSCGTLSNCLTEIRSNDSGYIGYIIGETFDENTKVKSNYLYGATISQTGVVRLDNSTGSTSQYTVPTSSILKSVWDNLNTRVNSVSTDLYGSYVDLTSEQSVSGEKNFLNNMGIGGVKSSNTRLVVKGTGTGSTSYGLNVIDSLNNSLFLVRDDGKVGIGTSSLSYPFEIKSNVGRILNIYRNLKNVGFGTAVTFSLNNGNDEKIMYGQIGGGIVSSTTGQEKGSLFFGVADGSGVWGNSHEQTKMFINRDGKVGIGTTIPSDILTLKSNNPRIRMDDSDTLNNGRITLDNNAIRIESDVDNLTSDSLIAFLVDNSIKMVIKDSGNVGIGTSNPLYTLDVLKSAGNASIRAKSDGIDSVSSIYIQNDSKSYAIQTDGGNNDKLIFYDNTAGSSRMVIDSFGNIGIGTISPTRKLTISGGGIIVDNNQGYMQKNTLGAEVSVLNLSSLDYTTIYSGRSGYGINFNSYNNNTLMSIKDNGNVGIGTDNPSAPFHIFRNGVAQQIFVQSSVGTVSGIRMKTNNSDWSVNSDDGSGGGVGGFSIYSNTSSSYRLLINSSGNVGIGTTSPTNKLTIVDGVDITGVDAGGSMLIQNSGYKLRIDSNEMQLSNNGTAASFSINSYGGNVYLASTLYVRGADSSVGIGTNNPSYKLQVAGTVAGTSWTATSDIRYKKNIRTITQALDKVEKIRGVNYEWKISDYKDMGFRTGENMGFIAQELEKIIPEVVDTDNKGYKSVEYANITAILVEAIKELRKEKNVEIDSLKKEIELLKKQ